MIYFTPGFFFTHVLPAIHPVYAFTFFRRNDAHLTLLKRRFDFDHISMINRMTA